MRIEIPHPGPPMNISLGGLTSVRGPVNQQRGIWPWNIRIRGFLNIDAMTIKRAERKANRYYNDGLIDRAIGAYGTADVLGLRRLFDMPPLIGDDYEDYWP
ncbi:uncharacterized protein LOC118645714 [Monomorium pharaonis]|uniref:uncharacterized protein LOC118645714 n=1 Tax=Monomorium pharaonis TaxID=307658 RepID=UPI0017461BA1|nr:uncharacterized protein LOC118645714 [Monomorium pharaonis]